MKESTRYIVDEARLHKDRSILVITSEPKWTAMHIFDALGSERGANFDDRRVWLSETRYPYPDANITCVAPGGPVIPPTVARWNAEDHAPKECDDRSEDDRPIEVFPETGFDLIVVREGVFNSKALAGKDSTRNWIRQTVTRYLASGGRVVWFSNPSEAE